MAAEDWILDHNPKPFTHILALLVGYEFDDEADWPAVRSGCEGTDVAQDKWFDYELVGQRRIKFSLAQDVGSSVIFVRCESDAELETKIEAIVLVVQSCRLHDD